MDDRRRNPRYAINVMVEVRSGEDKFIAQARNLSMCGMGFTLNRQLQDQSVVELNFHLDESVDPSRTWLTAKAEIIWAMEADGGSFNTGVRFVELTPDQRRRLQGIIDLLAR